jgi:hypothetical protein
MGCSSGEDGGKAGAESSGSTPGVTEDTIKVGVTYTDLEAIRDVIDIDHGDYEATYQALFDDMNERGLIDGRRIEAVYAPVNPIGTESAEEACVKLTEQEKVFVTVGSFLNDSMLCHAEEHESAVIGGTMTPQRLARAKAPWFTTEPSADLQTDAVREFDEAELFTGKFAVYAIKTDEALLRDLIEPAFAEFGLQPVEVAVADVPGGDSANTEQTLAMIDRWKKAGVTQVFVVGQGAIGWLNGLEQTSYRPQTLFASGAIVGTWINDSVTEHDLSVLEGAVSADNYGGRVNQYREPNMRLCVDGALKEHGIEVPEPTDGPAPKGVPDPFSSALVACKNVALLEGLLTNVEGELTYETFREAADLMGDIPMPSADRPYRYGSPPHADGDAAAHLFDYKADLRTFVLRKS